MRIAQQLFQGEHICLGPIDHERDAEIESFWTHQSDYMRLTYLTPALPRSVAQVKKLYETLEKDQEERHDQFYFTIRMCTDDRLIGFTRLSGIEWTNGSGLVHMSIGDPADRSRGYGKEALNLTLRYAFDELNLYRLTAMVAEYNLAAQRLFEKAGFTQEVRRRQALNRDGRRWDLFHYGILFKEWKGGRP
jgi:RimJ/RimL family protein N-acetyltransferase